MDIHQLELFLAVMESPSMTRAAEKVFLSPGAVSLQLHNLADELHTELFVRTGKRLIPTPAAQRLAEHAKDLIKRMGQIKLEFENDLATDTRPFHFATGVTTLIYQLGKPLRQLRKQYPKAEIRVSVNVTEETVAGLHDRRFDLGLISLPVPEENLKIIPLFDEELMIVRPSSNKVRGHQTGSVRVAELTRVPFLLYPRGTVLRVLIDRFFKDIGVSPRVVMEAEDTEAIKRLVESGFGYSILPRTRSAAANRILPNLPGRWTSHHAKSGARDGADGLSAQTHAIDRGIAAGDVDCLTARRWPVDLSTVQNWSGTCAPHRAEYPGWSPCGRLARVADRCC